MGIRLGVDVDPDGRWVRADEPRFQEIIWNLVDNAVKYSAGGGSVTIASSAAENGMVRIEVSDSGAGIAPERIPDLFSPFHRTTGPRGAKGTGLGLYIVKVLAEMHGGSVSVSTAPGQGATFCVTLPAAKGARHPPRFQYVDARSNAAVADETAIDPRPITETFPENGANGEFMRWISYELRAPLTPLLAAAELLAR